MISRNTLEDIIEGLQDENEDLEDRIKELKEEVDFLKGILSSNKIKIEDYQ